MSPPCLRLTLLWRVPLLLIVLSARLTLASYSQTAPEPKNNNNNDHLLTPFEHAATPFLRTAGVVDVLSAAVNNSNDTTTTTTTEPEEIGICHVGIVMPLTALLAAGHRIAIPIFDLVLGGVAAVQLAMDMMNAGDGSVVTELHNLNHHCPIRFTTQGLDSSANPTYAADQIVQMLPPSVFGGGGASNPNPNTTAQHSQQPTSPRAGLCAVLGSMRSAVTIPTSILTSLAKRPHLSPWSTSSQLDDKETFKMFGRLITSEMGLVVPFLAYLQDKGIDRLAVVHWNDEYGTSWVRALLQRATELYPSLQVVAVDIPGNGVTQEDYVNAVNTLQKTNVRWFFGLMGEHDVEAILRLGVEAGIAGTGQHVWIFNSAGFVPFFDGMVHERESALAKAVPGVGIFSAQNGRPGMDVFDKFAKRYQALNTPQNLAILESMMQNEYPDTPDFVRAPVTSTSFVLDPSVLASTMFDTTVMLGLAACATAAASADGITVDGQVMFQNILETTFEGATGTVTLDQRTGSRVPKTAIFRMTNVVRNDEASNATHVVFKTQDSQVFSNGTWNEEIPYIYNDGTSRVPSGLPPYETEYNYIGTILRSIGLGMSGSVLLLSMVFACWTIQKRNAHVVRASQPIFLILLCIGTFLLGATIVPLSIDDEFIDESGCTFACAMAPWFASVGFVTIFSSLFSKTWRVNRLFHNPDMRRIKLAAYDVMAPLVGLLTINLIVLTVWTVISPLEWVREVSDRDRFRRPVESRGGCESDNALPFVIILVVVDIGALILAAYQSYVARGIATEFAESEYIGKAIACMLLVSFVGVPTVIIVSGDPRARFFVTASIICVLCTAVLLFIFVPKIHAYRKKSFNRKSLIQKSARKRAILGLESSPPSSPDPIDQNGDIFSSGGIKILSRPQDIERLNNENINLRSENQDLIRQVSELRSLTSGNPP